MIVVVDYGMGNLRSVSKALEHLGAKVKVSSAYRDVEAADKLVLPGVGAFGDAARELRASGLFDPVKNYITSGKLFLGICLGMQLLFPKSEESPGAEGLGVFKGKVEAFPRGKLKVPHMGWNRLKIRQKHPLLQGIPDGSYVYFVHSFFANCADPSIVAATCDYGCEFAAIIGHETAFATQFHPEKSQKAGLKILENFIAW